MEFAKLFPLPEHDAQVLVLIESDDDTSYLLVRTLSPNSTSVQIRLSFSDEKLQLEGFNKFDSTDALKFYQDMVIKNKLIN